MQLKLKQNQCIAIDWHNNTPVCKECLESYIEDWLLRRRPSLIPKLRKKAEIFFKSSNYTNHVICSICYKQVNTCDFCFRQYIREWIENKYPRLLAEFRLFFGYAYKMY